jgi:hypothetical protein
MQLAFQKRRGEGATQCREGESAMRGAVLAVRR